MTSPLGAPPLIVLRELDGGVDRGELRHAVELDELEQRQAQQRADVRVEAARLAAEARQDVVEESLPGERAVDELGGERAVARRPERAAQVLPEDGVGESAVLDGVSTRQARRRGSAGGALCAKPLSRGEGAAARELDRAASRLRPSSWSSSIARTPSPVATRMASLTSTMRPACARTRRPRGRRGS